jgi:hypothetical protein
MVKRVPAAQTSHPIIPSRARRARGFSLLALALALAAGCSDPDTTRIDHASTGIVRVR